MRTAFVIIGLLGCLTSIAQSPLLIIGRNTGQKTLADGNAIRTFGFADQVGQNPPVPGPTIEVNQGDSVIIDFWNISQGAPHTIHLHGLDVNQQNDGVPHLSFEVHHMEHGYYRFKAPHAGTYLYHCHVVSSIHVQAGMYGMLIVHPPDGSGKTWEGGYDIHSETTLLMSEIDTNWHHDSVLLHEYDTSNAHHHVPIPVYDPQHFLINGASEQQLDGTKIMGQANSNVYVRLANIGFLGNRVVFPTALNARIIDSDGRPLPLEEATDTIELFPGERYGVLCNPDVEFNGNIKVQYVNMNTGAIADEQEMAVEIEGYWSVDEPEDSDYEVFPSPAREEITLRRRGGYFEPETRLVIQAIDGKVMKETAAPTPGANAQIISISELPPGVYLLHVMNAKDGQRHPFVKL